MPLGPGKYDAVLTEVREKTGGDVILIVLNGNLGHGFSAQVSIEGMVRIPSLLRQVARDIESSTPDA
jgi:hypothetical protein